MTFLCTTLNPRASRARTITSSAPVPVSMLVLDLSVLDLLVLHSPVLDLLVLDSAGPATLAMAIPRVYAYTR